MQDKFAGLTSTRQDHAESWQGLDRLTLRSRLFGTDSRWGAGFFGTDSRWGADFVGTDSRWGADFFGTDSSWGKLYRNMLSLFACKEYYPTSHHKLLNHFFACKEYYPTAHHKPLNHFFACKEYYPTLLLPPLRRFFGFAFSWKGSCTIVLTILKNFIERLTFGFG